jgi:hypothetical protein
MRRIRPPRPLLVFAAAVASVTGSAGAAPTTESWDAVYMGGAKVGHIHTYIEPVRDRGRELLRVRVDMSLAFKRLNDKVTMGMQYGTIETPDGSVLRLDTRILAAANEMRAHGDVIGGKMRLRFEGAGERQESVIDWGPDVRGPYAAEQSLSRSPMKPGETRALKMYMPDLNRVCDIALTAHGSEDVALGGGSTRSLLRVEQTTRLDDKPRPEFDVTLWVDPGGQVLKSKTDTLGGLVTFRTTREGAEGPNVGAPQFDQITNSVVKVKHRITRPEATRDVRYKVTLKGADLREILPTDRRQSVEAGASKGEAILEVKTAGPGAGDAGSAEVDPVFLRPNAMITSRDPRVAELARQAAGGATDPWEQARRVSKWVAQNLRNKNFEIGFAPASEVARDLAGDCTEHGVLVAAMCRALGIPARVAVGLVYVDSLGGFGFHLWNEVYVNKRWVAVDATFDQDEVDAVHIKLSDASLDGVSPYEAFLPIVRVLGKMTLDPIEIR